MTLLFFCLKIWGVLSALGQLGVLAHVDFGLRRGVSAVCNARASYFVVDFGLRRGVSAGRNARASYFAVDFGGVPVSGRWGWGIYTALSDLTIAPPFIPPIAKIGAEV